MAQIICNNLGFSNNHFYLHTVICLCGSLGKLVMVQNRYWILCRQSII